MNPLIIFDYVYYKFAFLYTNSFGYEEQKEFAGALFLSLIQLCNIVTIINFITPIKEFSLFDPVFIFIGILVLIISFNLIRYYKFVSYSKLDGKWRKDVKKSRIIKGISVIIYIVLSLFLFIYFANVNQLLLTPLPHDYIVWFAKSSNKKNYLCRYEPKL